MVSLGAMSSTDHTLGRPASFWVSAGVVAHTLWTSAAPAMTYPLYAKEWHLTPTVTTGIFATYPIVVVAILILFGDLSDHIGRRATLLLGLAASMLGVLAFALAPSVYWVFAGRALMGVGVGLSAGPSAAAMVDFSAAGRSRYASSIATAAQSFGVAMAFLLGGGLIQYAPFPMSMPFWVLFVVLAGLFAGTWFLPHHVVKDETPARWRVRVPSIPARLRWIFAVSTVSITTAYTHGAVFLSLGAQVAHDLVGSSNTLVNGAALSLFAVFSGAAGIMGRSLASRSAAMLGAISSAVAMGFLTLSVFDHNLAVFLIATAAAGTGYSLLFLGGLGLINAAASAEHRGGTLSAVFLVAYLTMGTIAMSLGVSATEWGLKTAIDIGAVVITLLSAGAIVLAIATPKAPVRTA